MSINLFGKYYTLYKERDEAKRAEFIKTISAIAPESIVFIDEAGGDHRRFRAYARAPRGVKIYADIPRVKNVNAIV